MAPGERRIVDLPVAKLSNHTPVSLPVHVLHGQRDGPTMFVSAAVHGDELNGVEIIRRILRAVQPGNVAGTLLCAPVVNAYGFIGRSRYLPDRRDLNRAFPGSAGGSLAARLAHLFLKEVVARSDFGIDLHTAAVHRVNLPQLRCRFGRNGRPDELALRFGVPVVLDSPERPGSMRRAAREIGVEVLVYEGGEGLRFDEFAIAAGARGITNVMVHRGMLEPANDADQREAGTAGQGEPMLANASKWLRAPDGGVFRPIRTIGNAVSVGDVVGFVTNPYEDGETPVKSTVRGVIIGRTTLPVVNMGDALFHIAWSAEHDRAPAVSKASLRAGSENTDGADPLLDEDEII